MTPTTNHQPDTPTEPFQLHLRPRRHLPDQEELALYRAAYQAAPAATPVRLNLARFLNALSHFEESATLLAAWAIDQFPFLHLAIKANLGIKTPAANEQARLLCLHSLTHCRTDAERSIVHTLLAEAAFAQFDFPTARAELLTSLELGGYQHEPYALLLRADIAQGRAAEVLAYADAWLDHGPPTSGIIASQILAHAQLGHIQQALDLQGLPRFMRQYQPDPPPGWPTLEAFNLDLAAEIANHPSIRSRVEGTSSRKTNHVPQPDLARSHVYHAFQQMIQREIAAYVAALPPDTDHPFLRMRQPAGTLANWCVLTEGEGHERWHQHPGWLSGTYYVQVPDHIASGSGLEGCIAFGLPEATATPQNINLFGETLCRPRPGLLVLFPSYVHHRTYPHHGPGQRICCAFDVDLVQ